MDRTDIRGVHCGRIHARIAKVASTTSTCCKSRIESVMERLQTFYSDESHEMPALSAPRWWMTPTPVSFSLRATTILAAAEVVRHLASDQSPMATVALADPP